PRQGSACARACSEPAGGELGAHRVSDGVLAGGRIGPRRPPSRDSVARVRSPVPEARETLVAGVGNPMGRMWIGDRAYTQLFLRWGSHRSRIAMGLHPL